MADEQPNQEQAHADEEGTFIAAGRRDRNDIGNVIGKFAEAIVEADGKAKDAHVRRVIRLAKEPNAELEATASLIGLDTDLRTAFSTPLLGITDVKPIEIKEAELEMDLTVNAAQSDDLTVGSKTHAEADFRLKWGPVDTGMKMSTDVSVDKATKRSSDYRNHTKAILRMGQADMPEGLQRIIDSLLRVNDAALKINESIIQDNLPLLLAQAKGAADAGQAEAPAQ